MSSVSHISPAEELAAFLARGPSPQEIKAFRLSDAALERGRMLLDKNEDGQLTPEEGRELDRLVLLDDIIALVQSQVRTPGGQSSGHKRSDCTNERHTDNGGSAASGAETPGT
jgi:hypothetical protein